VGSRKRFAKGSALPASAAGSALYRQLNDIIRAAYRDAVAADIEVVCECEDLGCTDLLRVDLSAYDNARRENRLLIAHAEP
jgi:hypothetical protein